MPELCPKLAYSGISALLYQGIYSNPPEISSPFRKKELSASFESPGDRTALCIHQVFSKF